MISNMIWRDVRGHVEEMERYPKHILNVTHIWAHRSILYAKILLQQADLLTLPGCIYPPVACLSLLVSNLFSKDKHKNRKVVNNKHAHAHIHTHTRPIKKDAGNIE